MIRLQRELRSAVRKGAEMTNASDARSRETGGGDGDDGSGTEGESNEGDRKRTKEVVVEDQTSKSCFYSQRKQIRKLLSNQ